MGRIQKHFFANWAFCFFVAVSISCIVRIFTGPLGGHCQIFFAAGRQVWNQIDPYGISYRSGFWIYSPSCALIFFAPFAFLPTWLGEGLYVLVSWGVFLLGANNLLDALEIKPNGRNVFWLITSSEMIGSLLNERLEIVLIGLMMWATPQIWRQKKMILASLCMAATCNWKMQMYPVAALTVVVWLLKERNLKFPLLLLGSLAFWYLIPLALVPWNYIVEIYKHFPTALSQHMRITWPDFVHVYRFPRVALGWPIDFVLAQIISAGVGTSLAIYVALRVLKNPKEEGLDSSYGLAFALGALFAASFSPMAQSAGFILYVPLLAYACHESLWNSAVLAGTWILTSALGSDLVPKALRLQLIEMGLKAYGPVGLGVFILIQSWPRASVSGPRNLAHKI